MNSNNIIRGRIALRGPSLHASPWQRRPMTRHKHQLRNGAMAGLAHGAPVVLLAATAACIKLDPTSPDGPGFIEVHSAKAPEEVRRFLVGDGTTTTAGPAAFASAAY